MIKLFYQAFVKAAYQSVNTCVNRRAQLLAEDIRLADRHAVEFEALREQSQRRGEIKAFGQAEPV